MCYRVGQPGHLERGEVVESERPKRFQARNRSESTTTSPRSRAAAEAAAAARKAKEAGDSAVSKGAESLPDSHHLPKGLRWDEFQLYFKGQPAEVIQDRWDLYLEESEKVAIRGVPYPPGITADSWVGQRVLVEDLGERGLITKAAHGFFIVQIDSREKDGEQREEIKKRGYELFIADDEDRLRLGQVSDDADEPRRAAPRPQPRKPTGVDIADRIWSQKETGVEWVRRTLARARSEEDDETAVSKIVIDSWGTQWHSETGQLHVPRKPPAPASTRPSARQSVRPSARPSAPPVEKISLPGPEPALALPQVKPAIVVPQSILERVKPHPAVSELAEGELPPVAPGAAHSCEKGKLFLVNGQKRISDGKAWRCEHYRQPSQCQVCGGAGVCEHGRRRSACLECNRDNPQSHLWRQAKR